jgi:hypothetical protein
MWLPCLLTDRDKMRNLYRGHSIDASISKKTTQWPKEKVQKDKQRSTKLTYKTKDRETRTPLKTGGAPLVAPVVLI